MFSATGNQALSMEELARVRDGAYIISATSRDDELCLNDDVEALFDREPLTRRSPGTYAPADTSTWSTTATP